MQTLPSANLIQSSRSRRRSRIGESNVHLGLYQLVENAAPRKDQTFDIRRHAPKIPGVRGQSL